MNYNDNYDILQNLKHTAWMYSLLATGKKEQVAADRHLPLF